MNILLVNSALPILAEVDFRNPALWMVIVGWTMSVVLHELAHGVVARLGGDYTIKGRGLLTLNPLKYIDPLFSIIIPLFFLITGGVPLAGGVTYIREDLLRSRLWGTAVSLAGPAVNFVLFLLLALPFHPQFGWIHPSLDVQQWTLTQQFLATLAMLQFVVCLINLIPIPPLDGFNTIKPWFDAPTRALLSSPQARYIGIFVLYLVVFRVPQVMETIYILEHRTLELMGFDDVPINLMAQAYNKVLFKE